MKEIELTRGQFALIDDEDYDRVSKYNWYAVCIKSRMYASNKKKGLMHRFILGLSDRTQLVDHKKGIGLNNQKSNLRLCTHQENMRNRKSSEGSSSKYLGVFWDKSRNKWMSCISISGRSKTLGRFETEVEAAIIYNIAARKYHGEFANPNKLK